MEYYMTTETLPQNVEQLCAGDKIFFSGEVYTARDAAHKRLKDLLGKEKASLPFPMQGAVIYYAGPTPSARFPVGACGPTTSSRMDIYAPDLYDLGVCATIGKGRRGRKVIEAIKRNHALYLCAVGGAGALASTHIIYAEEIAFNDLGCESIKRLTFDRFPLYVGIDSFGRHIFQHEDEYD